jgi:hypothetical protein
VRAWPSRETAQGTVSVMRITIKEAWRSVGGGRLDARPTVPIAVARPSALRGRPRTAHRPRSNAAP